MTKNFKLEEFACKDGTPVPPDLIPNVQNLANQLQVLRDHLNEPIFINSAYRTIRYNQAVGGSPKSMHIQEKAADIRVKSKTPRELAKIIEGLIKDGKMVIGGMGVYPTFVHIDTRKLRTRW